jgi:hypothetical protein
MFAEMFLTSSGCLSYIRLVLVPELDDLVAVEEVVDDGNDDDGNDVDVDDGVA